MSKLLLSGEFMKKNVKIRTSKFDIVCRYLLFSIAKDIGPNTLKLVRFLCPSNISDSNCLKLDEILTTDVFSPAAIEKAAYATLNSGLLTYGSFQCELFFP